MVVAKLNPSVGMYLELPNGWQARSKEFSGELFILCPSCTEKKLSLPTPIILTPEDLAEVRAKLPQKPKKEVTIASRPRNRLIGTRPPETVSERTVSTVLEHQRRPGDPTAVIQQRNLEIIAKTIEIKDSQGLKMRMADVLDFADKMQWIAAQLDSLRNMLYDMQAEDLAGPRRRPSTQTLQAVVPGDKKNDGE